MRLKTLFATAIFLIALSLTSQLSAQQFWGNDRLYDYYLSKGNTEDHAIQRFTVGIGKHYLWSNVDLNYQNTLSDGTLFDTTATTRATLKKAYNGSIGTFFPIYLLSDNSMITFNAELYAAFGTLVLDSTVFGEYTKFDKEYLYYMVGIPLSVEYKTGADIPLSKKGSNMFSLGIGMNFCKTNYVGDNGPFPITFAPFVKAEFGFILGVAMKVRGMAYFGSAFVAEDRQYYIGKDENGNKLNDLVDVTAQINNGYSLSLIVMPFTYKWISENW